MESKLVKSGFPLGSVAEFPSSRNFSNSSSMTISNHSSFYLHAKALQAMIDAGFEPDFPPGVAHELQALEGKQQTGAADQVALDLRPLIWSSIDNSDSRDL